MDDSPQITGGWHHRTSLRPAACVWTALLILLIHLACFAGICLAQGDPNLPGIVSSEPAGPGKDSTRLIVLDADTGRPIPDATVVTGYHYQFPGRVESRFPGKSAPPMLRTDQEGAVVIPGRHALAGGLGIWSADHAPCALFLNLTQGYAAPDIAGYIVKLERGTSLGGILRDEAGQPQAKVHVSLTLQHGNTDSDLPPRVHEHPIYDPAYAPEMVTDAQGRWTCAHFPSQVEALTLRFQRDDGSLAQFQLGSVAGLSNKGAKSIDLEATRRGELVSIFKQGTDVRGTVVDASGQPLVGIRIVETDHRPISQPISVAQTDADGRFLFPNRDPHQLLLTLTSPGLATSATLVNVTPGMSKLTLPMQPAKPLRVRVVDAEGRPRGGISVSPKSVRYAWSGITDKEGRVAWEQAPAERLLYNVRAEMHVSGEPRSFAARMVRLLATAEEQTVTLPDESKSNIAIQIKATDEDGATLKDFVVTKIDLPEGAGLDEAEAREKLPPPQDGVCQGTIPIYDLSDHNLRLRVEAPDRAPFLMATALREDSDDLNLTVILPKTGTSQITLHLPDGQPASGAEVAARNNQSNLGPYPKIVGAPHGTPKFAGQDLVTVKANAAGEILLPNGLAALPVVILHEGGYLITTVGHLRAERQAQLTAWARLEGRLTVNGEPKAEQELLVDHYFKNGVSFDCTVTTDRDGRFAFERFPVGQFTLFCAAPSQCNWGRGYPVEVKTVAAETARLAYEIGGGRALVGKATLVPPDATFDWQQDTICCELTSVSKTADARACDWPAGQDYVSAEDYLLACRRYERTHQTDGTASSASYKLRFDADGSFRTENIPPGTYVLSLFLTKVPDPPVRPAIKNYGFANPTVIVPPAFDGQVQVPVDLGVTEVKNSLASP